MPKRFSISAGTVHAVLQKLGERPYVEVEGLINAIRADVKPIDDGDKHVPEVVPHGHKKEVKDIKEKG